MRISDWSSDVCSSDLTGKFAASHPGPAAMNVIVRLLSTLGLAAAAFAAPAQVHAPEASPATEPAPALRVMFIGRSEEQTSELQSLMRISYAVFCLKEQTLEIQQLNYSALTVYQVTILVIINMYP